MGQGALPQKGLLQWADAGGAKDMISDPEAFFARGCGRCTRFDTPDCAARIWTEGLIVLRRLCRDAGLSEHAK